MKKLSRIHTFFVEKEVEGKKKQFEFFLRQPNRRMKEEGELFHGKWINKAMMDEGLLPKALLAKKFAEYNGIYTDDEKKNYVDLINKVRELELEGQQIIVKDAKIRSDKEKKRVEEIEEELYESRLKIQNYELQQDGLYNYTAEHFAHRKFTMWWVAQSTYEALGDLEEIVLKGDSYDDKMDYYDELIEKDQTFYEDVFSKAGFYIAIWLNPSIGGNVEAFKQMIDILEKEDSEARSEEEEKEKIKEEIKSKPKAKRASKKVAKKPTDDGKA